MDNNTNLLATAKKLLTTQKKRLIIISSVVVLVIGGLAGNFVWQQKDKKSTTLEVLSKKAPVYDVTREVSDRNYWMHQAELELQKNLKETQETQNKAAKLEERLNKLEQNKTPGGENKDERIGELLTRLSALEAQLTQNQAPAAEQGSPNTTNDGTAKQSGQWQRPTVGVQSSPRKHLPIHLNFNNIPNNATNNAVSSQGVADGNAPNGMPSTTQKVLNTDHFQVNASARDYLDIKNWILSGTFIRGILLNGMDVSTGEAARVNPTHVAIQLVEPGNLPNYHSGQFKHCVVLGAAHGDKSSERAKVRLERLTCVWNIDGEDKGVSTDVFGYVVGIDGKEGVRGKMIKRDKEAISKAFWAKFIGGMGDLLSQGAGQQSITPQGNMLRTFDGKELIKGGLASGTGGAFDLLSQMAIKEIDKLSDIIQINGGQAVDLVFVADMELTKKRGETSKPQTGGQVNHINQVFE